VGGCREILAEESHARLVQPHDAAALCCALNVMLALRVDRRAMAERYASRFSWQANARELVRLMADG